MVFDSKIAYSLIPGIDSPKTSLDTSKILAGVSTEKKAPSQGLYLSLVDYYIINCNLVTKNITNCL